jgi:hypothetical protein
MDLKQLNEDREKVDRLAATQKFLLSRSFGDLAENPNFLDKEGVISETLLGPENKPELLERTVVDYFKDNNFPYLKNNQNVYENAKQAAKDNYSNGNNIDDVAFELAGKILLGIDLASLKSHLRERGVGEHLERFLDANSESLKQRRYKNMIGAISYDQKDKNNVASLARALEKDSRVPIFKINDRIFSTDDADEVAGLYLSTINNKDGEEMAAISKSAWKKIAEKAYVEKSAFPKVESLASYNKSNKGYTIH